MKGQKDEGEEEGERMVREYLLYVRDFSKVVKSVLLRTPYMGACR